MSAAEQIKEYRCLANTLKLYQNNNLTKEPKTMYFEIGNNVKGNKHTFIKLI